MHLFMIELLENLIMDSERVVGFTGAGISTDSGIPDFRSPQSGLWERYDPTLMDARSFERDPTAFFEMAKDLGMTIFSAKPNVNHNACTKLQEMGKMDNIITQNIDDLHQKSGSKNVIELHGNLKSCECTKCKKKFPIEILVEKALVKGLIPPPCDACREGILKPDAVFFGEALPQDKLERAIEVASNCDLFLVLGSSLLVYPAAILPKLAVDNGAQLAIVNIQETPYDPLATITLNLPLREVLPRIVENLEYRIGRGI
ncbi:MAG: NAD-dependent protein deacylase [Candidatus Hodarchaeota archaeon]